MAAPYGDYELLKLNSAQEFFTNRDAKFMGFFPTVTFSVEKSQKDRNNIHMESMSCLNLIQHRSFHEQGMSSIPQ